MAPTLTDKRRTRWSATPTQAQVTAQRAFYSLTVPSPTTYKTITDLEVAYYKVASGVPNPPGVLNPTLADWRYYFFGLPGPASVKTSVSDREYSFTGATPPIPPLPTTNLRAQWKADALALADGASIASWVDSTANAFNAVNAGATKPTFKTNGLNSLPVVRFGPTQNLVGPQITNVTDNYAQVLVVKANPLGVDGVPMMVGDNTGGWGIALPANGGTNYGFLRAAVSWTGTGVAADSNWAILLVRVTAGNLQFYKNGGSPIFTQAGATTTVPAATTRFASYQGPNNNPFDIAEALVYNAAVPTVDMNAIGAYLAAKWGFTWTTIP